ncbi:MAG: TetR/AcrR family transcriptional regulator [Desulfobulbaceae bacterium]|nr:TetR/AcrR family transcriptional regulator [Desulfobulbaceae bacterium]
MQPKKKTSIRRQEILHAALETVGENGVSALTIAAIASRAGMCEANIYRHFRGKQEILNAIGDFIGEEVMGRAAKVAAGKGRALDKLEAIFFAHTALIGANPGLPRFIFSDEILAGEPQLGEAMARRMGTYVRTVGGIIAAGMAAGEFRQELAPPQTATTMLGMIQFTVRRWSLSRGAMDLEAEAAALWDNFRRIIAKTEPATTVAAGEGG